MRACRILLVEDDVAIGFLLAELLAEMGHDVCEIARTEADAVAAAGRLRPGLMIVDVNLANGSDISAVRTILRAGPVPHMFISGAIALAAPPGAVMLQKPFREADLARAIQCVLGPDAG